MKKFILLIFLFAIPLYGQETPVLQLSGTSWQGDYPNYSGSNTWTNLQYVVSIPSCETFSCMAILNPASCVTGESTCTPPFLIGVTTPFDIPNNSIITSYDMFTAYLESVNNNGGADSGNINIVNFTLCVDPPPNLNPSNVVSCGAYAIFTPQGDTIFPTTVASIPYPLSENIFGSNLPTISQVNAGIGVILQTSITRGAQELRLRLGLLDGI